MTRAPHGVPDQPVGSTPSESVIVWSRTAFGGVVVPSSDRRRTSLPPPIISYEALSRTVSSGQYPITPLVGEVSKVDVAITRVRPGTAAVAGRVAIADHTSSAATTHTADAARRRACRHFWAIRRSITGTSDARIDVCRRSADADGVGSIRRYDAAWAVLGTCLRRRARDKVEEH